jgi:hypothetical protein
MRGMELNTSLEEMLDLNPYVECLCKCYHSISRKGRRGRKVMRWMRAVRVQISYLMPFTILTLLRTHTCTDVRLRTPSRILRQLFCFSRRSPLHS